MSFNQASLFFYPPRWQQRLTSHPTAITFEHKPVQFVDSVLVAGVDAPAVATTAIKAWLIEKGFAPVDYGGGLTFHRGQVRSYFGLVQEIDICLGDESGEISVLDCRFALRPRVPPPLSEWAGMMAELCERFMLRLGAEGVAPCGVAEFISAVRMHQTYMEFAARFGWETGPI